MSYGIDTLKVGFTVGPDQMDFNKWLRVNETKVQDSDEAILKISYRKMHKAHNGTVVRITYVQRDFLNRMFNQLLIEFSLPKLLYGCNHRDIENLEDALDRANKAIAQVDGLPKLPDIRTATLYRIDLCTNLQVGSMVPEYIHAIGRAHKSRRKRSNYSDTGVQFRAREISETLYDKGRECGHEEAQGILRFEISLRRKRKIAAFLGQEDIKLADITLDLIRTRLLASMTSLHLDKPIMSERSKVESILSEAYPSNSKRLRLLGYWATRQEKTVDEMKQEGYSKDSIWRLEKQLAEAGISANGNLGGRELPALTPLLEEGEGRKKCDEISVTYGSTSNRTMDLLDARFTVPDPMVGSTRSHSEITTLESKPRNSRLTSSRERRTRTVHLGRMNVPGALRQ